MFSKKYTFSGAVLSALLLVPAALAGSGPVVAGYGGSAGQVQNTIAKPSAVAAQHVSGILPFTGMNLALFVLVAALLTGLGFGLRRLGRGSSNSR